MEAVVLLKIDSAGAPIFLGMRLGCWISSNIDVSVIIFPQDTTFSSSDSFQRIKVLGPNSARESGFLFMLFELGGDSSMEIYWIKVSLPGYIELILGVHSARFIKWELVASNARKNIPFTKGTPVVILEDGEDPFAFDQDYSGLSKSSNCQKSMTLNSSEKNVHITERTPTVILEDNHDQFAFDEDDIEPSQWDLQFSETQTISF
ncbi:unnamed protein product [Vicia faba]|uniref:Uncharacterized protein n=1 Tax=Vicia faba TaxID=3906 RepID=A0AAV1AY63_VICFA|nr:unnamed protein product [Vicia faba]